MDKRFNADEYAASVWTSQRIDFLENSWKEQREYWYNLLRPLIPPAKTVLDVGCGVGAYYDLLKEKAREYTGIDITSEMIERAKKNHPDGKFQVSSIYKIDFPDKSFDLVFCWSVLCHQPPHLIESALSELWRVAKKHLFFNFYVLLSGGILSVKGSWDELLTGAGMIEVLNMISRLDDGELSFAKDYEEINHLAEVPFQRKIFLIERERRCGC